MEVNHIGQIGHVGVEVVVTLGVRERRASGTRFTFAQSPRRISLARSAITPVASVSAGPPLGGLYLNPPSRGGLCDGVTTIPSESTGGPAAVVGRGWHG